MCNLSWTPHSNLEKDNSLNHSCVSPKMGCLEYTVVPVFRGLCDQGTPAVSGQYTDVRGDFQYKLTLDQGTPANADRHFCPSARGQCFIYFIFHHTRSQTLSHWVTNVIESLC